MREGADLRLSCRDRLGIALADRLRGDPTVGDRTGNSWIVTNGLNAGDRIIVEGPTTRDGTVVTPKPSIGTVGPSMPCRMTPS